MIDCLYLDQRTFGSMIRQGLIEFEDNKEAFIITPKGRAVFKAYLHTDTIKEHGMKFAPSVQVLIEKIGVKPKVIQMVVTANQKEIRAAS